jgi:aspartate 1-decarboxylase
MQLRQLLKSKLHHARITYCEPEYMGSIEIDATLMDRAGIAEGELVHVWAVDHQARLETYALRGGKGVIGLNGGAAHYFRPGDRVVIAAFALTDEELTPRVLLLDEHNQVLRDLSPAAYR